MQLFDKKYEQLCKLNYRHYGIWSPTLNLTTIVNKQINVWKQHLPRLRVVSNFGDRDCGAGEILTRARVKFRGDVTRGERQKLETTDLAREFELNTYIPSAKLWLALSWIPVNNLATVHKPLSTLMITPSTPFQFTEMADIHRLPGKIARVV